MSSSNATCCAIALKEQASKKQVVAKNSNSTLAVPRRINYDGSKKKGPKILSAAAIKGAKLIKAARGTSSGSLIHRAQTCRFEAIKWMHKQLAATKQSRKTTNDKAMHK